MICLFMLFKIDLALTLTSGELYYNLDYFFFLP